MTTLNATAIVLDELKRWTEYKIWVLAGTSVGDGPRSYPMTVRTHEDGMYFQFAFPLLAEKKKKFNQPLSIFILISLSLYLFSKYKYKNLTIYLHI